MASPGWDKELILRLQQKRVRGWSTPGGADDAAGGRPIRRRLVIVLKF
jgi:hypothetical protein